MRHPTSKFGAYELHYVQVPFDDRYVLVKRKNKVLMKIVRSYNDAFNMGTYVFIDMTNATAKQFEKFVTKCYLYDQYLDSRE